MPAPHYTLTLDNSIQQLSDALGTGYTSPGSSRDVRVRTIIYQPDGANANPIYVGGENADVSSSNYGHRLEAATATVPPAPMVIEYGERGIRPSDIHLIGTNGEKLHFQLIEA